MNAEKEKRVQGEEGEKKKIFPSTEFLFVVFEGSSKTKTTRKINKFVVHLGK